MRNEKTTVSHSDNACDIVHCGDIVGGSDLCRGRNDYAPTGTALTQALLGTWLEDEDPHNPNSGKIYKMPSGSYYLAEDIYLVGDDAKAWPLIISEGAFTLDLNGHVLDLKRQNISIYSNVSLTLTDSNPNAEHKFRVEDSGLWVWDETRGTKTVAGGVITGGTGVEGGSGIIGRLGGGVCVSSGRFTMEGGSIVGCTANSGGGVGVSSGSFTMNGGRITGCTAVKSGNNYGSGGGVRVDENSSFTMEGGSITDCTAADVGGGVCVSSGSFTMEGGSIVGCTASGGGGVDASGNSFTMKGGSITDCTANNGGGVNVAYGSFTMAGGSITDCTANNGGGIYVQPSSLAKLTMSNGSITNCTATYAGGGVFVCSDYESGSFTMEGGSITNCKAGSAANAVHADGNFTDNRTSKIDKSLVSGINGGHTGSETDPILIGSAEGLKDFRNRVNNGQTGLCATLVCDIVLNDGTFDENGTYTGANGSTSAEQWTPIGNGGLPSAYCGTFDGNGHTIKGLYINSDNEDRVGLFGYTVYPTVIHNLTVDGYVKGKDDVGGIVGYAYYTNISNCYNTGTISGNNWVGGIAGVVDSTAISSCYNTGTISGNNCVGGIAGVVDSTTAISSCYNIGTVNGNNYVGGIVGAPSSANISNCYYLTGTANNGGGGEAKSKEEFANGTVLNLLKNGDENSPWTKCGYLSAAGMIVPLLNGQTSDTFPIYTAEDLKQFRDMVNGGNTGICAKLMNDIVLNDGTFDENGNWSESGTPDRWTPIGDSNHTYAGTFDGGGHTIKGLYINRDESGIGLFGIVSNATIKNLTVTGYVKGYGSVGGIVGEILEEGNATIQNCANYCEVTGDTYVGGIVGYIGYNTKGDIRNCANFGTVKGTCIDGSSVYVGGIVGLASIGQEMTVVCTACYNVGTVKAKKCAGGLLGYGSMKMDSCYNVGLVEGEELIGGLVGSALWLIIDGNGMSLVTVDNCYYLDTATKAFGEALFFTGDTSAWCKSKTQFANELLSLLQNGDENSPWEKCGYLKSAGMTLPLLSWQTADAHTHNKNGNLGGCDCGQLPAGTETDPYLISTADELKAFRDLVNSGKTDICAKLMNDIVLNDGTFDKDGNWSESGTPDAWTPIGWYKSDSDQATYAGTFDGGGHTIKGLYVNGDNSPQMGLFGCIYGAAIKNLTVTGYVKGGERVGGIVGESSGGTYIENCTNVCTVAGSSSYIGGIAGALFSNTDPTGIRNCTNFGSISGSSQVGGIVGTLIGISGTSEIIGCRNTGNVSAKKSDLGSASAGGIAGYIVRSKVTDCHNEGDVSAVNTTERGNADAGGIAANIMDADEIVNCVNTGNVSGSGEQHTYIGGIAGMLSGKINKVNCCYNTGKVSGAGDRTRIGGIIGYLSSESTKVYCCYNTGAVSGTGNKSYVGGIVGFLEINLTNGAVIRYCYWLENTAEKAVGLNNNGGTEADTAVKIKWDFANGDVLALLKQYDTTGAWGKCGYLASAGMTLPLLSRQTADAHDHSYEWNHDDTQHWKECSCSVIEVGSTAAHSGTATCIEQATCEICHEKYGAKDSNNHVGSKEWTIKNETEHEQKYSCCDKVTVAKEAHEWKNGTCNECGYVCTHRGGTATCTEQATCETCGEKYGDLLPHTFTKEDTDAKYLKSAATCTTKAVYYHSCSECGEKGTTTFEYGNKLGHSFTKQDTDAKYLKSAATCTARAVYYYSCSACGEKGRETFVYGDTLPHNAETSWSHDSTNHWHDCISCGGKTNIQLHIWGDITIIDLKTGAVSAECKVCGSEYVGSLKDAAVYPSNGYIYGIEPETKVEKLNELFGTDITVSGAKNGLVGTGTTISINGKIYTVVIKGDINGDGKITAADYVKVRMHILKRISLDGAELLASHVITGSSKPVSAADYIAIRRHILGIKLIAQ